MAYEYDTKLYNIIHTSEDSDAIMVAVKQSAINSECNSSLEQNAYGLGYLAAVVANSNRIINSERAIDLESDRIKPEGA